MNKPSQFFFVVCDFNAYNILTTITQKAIENAGVVAETYNGLNGLLNAVKDKAQAIASKIAAGRTPSKSELAALQLATKQGAEQLQASLDAMRAGLGDKINAETAKLLQTQIDQLKAHAQDIGSPATALVAAQALAKTDPVALVKEVKKLPPLGVEYNGKVYASGSKIIISNKEDLSNLALKNTIDGEPISWIVKNGNAIVHHITANPVGLIWPESTNSLTIETSQGDRKMNIELKKKVFTFTDLVATDNNNPSRKAIGSKNETLYIVRAPNTTRTINYVMNTAATKNDFLGIEPIWSTTLPKNGLYEGEVFNGINSKTGETRHTSESKGEVSAVAFDSKKGVKVEVVDGYRIEAEVVPPATKNAIEALSKYVDKIGTIFHKLDPSGKLEFKVTYTGEEFLEEIDKSRFYKRLRSGGIGGQISFSFKGFKYGYPYKFANLYVYIKPIVSISTNGKIVYSKRNDQQKFISEAYNLSFGPKFDLEAGGNIGIETGKIFTIEAEPFAGLSSWAEFLYDSKENKISATAGIGKPFIGIRGDIQVLGYSIVPSGEIKTVFEDIKFESAKFEYYLNN